MLLPHLLEVKDWKERYRDLTGEDLTLCPACKQGGLIGVETLRPLASQPVKDRFDTS